MTTSLAEPVAALAVAPGTASAFFTDPSGREPIRAELYGLEHLELHARRLAAGSATQPRTDAGHPLLRRFVQNGRRLNQAHERIIRAARQQEVITPDAEWLLDNFHIVADTLREIRHDLPHGYYKKLPKLADGPLVGMPRVFALALELIAHTDSSLEETSLTRFVLAYQAIAPLTIGELWAVPIMLRLGLIENLRRLGEQMLESWSHRRAAESCTRQLMRLREQSLQSEAQSTLFGLVQPRAGLADPFVVRLIQALRDHGPEASWLIEWLETHFAACGVHPTEVLRREHQRQAANQVSVGNCVTSLRLLSALDWTVLFERMSLVEALLRDDPAGVYQRQDFATKDRYRREVEKLARHSGADELTVARRALELARQEPSSDNKAAGRHVGFFLLGAGRGRLNAHFSYRPPLRDRIRDASYARPGGFYFGALAVVYGLLLIGVAGYVAGAGWSWSGLVLLAAALVPLSEMAVSLVHYVITLILPPRVLPKLDFKDGIPGEAATFVVMPTMLIRPESATVLTDRLEVHYLSNSDPQLCYALLTDFADSPTEDTPEDEDYVRDALERIESLNDRYCPAGPRRFFLFHRRRRYNPAEQCWMGWERKRGKLAEFNRILRGATDTSFAWTSAPISELPQVHFVITLDADTQLPRETASRLIGTLAHPLNRARFDPGLGRVVAGYGVLQPRVSLSLVAATRSLFAKILTSSAGLDPYTTAVSDVYQDLFGLGSFTGKGIYDVDAFAAATGHTFPENAILSHDLIEGNYARCGLVTDIELLDDFPARYHAYARREHRWVRGDWQILPWLFPTVRGPDGGGERTNPLPALARWKIFDNLRRSVVPPALLLLLALGWLCPVGSTWFWTGLALAAPAFPLLVILIDACRNALHTGALTLKARELAHNLGSTGGQVLLSLVFLAEQARQLLDAIGRTLARLYTGRHLLEWETAATTERRLGTDFSHFCMTMWPASLLALILGGLVAAFQPSSWLAALGILTGWFLSPLVAFWVSRPRILGEPPLTIQERRELRRLARKTWEFFETFVVAEDNWLPPDNYQEDPKAIVAHRTSPTNVGLALLSTLAAFDFGYLSFAGLVDRLEKAFDTLDRLERHRGHFYNWYDTRTLQPLQPAYVSTVDSGNLLGCLLALKHGLLEKAEATTRNPAVRAGLEDTLDLIGEELHNLEPPAESEPLALFQALEADLSGLRAQLRVAEADRAICPKFDPGAGKLAEHTRTLCRLLHEVPEELQRWTQRFQDQLRDLAAAKEDTWPGLRERCRHLAERTDQLARAMDFRFLYHEQRHLFAIGFNLGLNRLDNAHYDLLASEACLTSFLAIARGDAPRRHWFHLSRPVTRASGGIALVSWGGTLFEYLMPRLLLRGYAGTLLDESCRAAVGRHMEYGREHQVPWGISESAFSALDTALDYQYQSFGVPGLGLKRGLGDNLVIAPYATALSLAIRPRAALINLRRLRSERAEGAYGLYEALDYTRERQKEGDQPALVRCFMAHHQGMSFVALANCLFDNLMVRRFHAEPMVRATELLLQEKVPLAVPLLRPGQQDVRSAPVVHEQLFPLSRRVNTPATPHPRTHLLSNGSYSVMVTNAGGGWSTWKDIDVTRWREDRTRDCWGQFCYIREMRSGRAWSAGHQPLRRDADEYEVIYSSDKAEFRRFDADLETHLEITVSPENAAELRRVTLVNHGHRAHELEVTSYAEIVLAAHGGDLAHPAFGKLFLETEFLPNECALLCRRRPRSAEQKPLWAVHVLAVEGRTVGDLEFETDRAAFLGRGRSPANPGALDPRITLGGTTGPVLDPIFSLRRRLRVAPGASATLAFTTAVAETRDEALALADQYHNFHGVTRAFELAWAHSQVQLRHLRLTAEETHLYQRLAAHVVYAGSTLRLAEAISANQQGQSGLWRHGISGDIPIVLVRLSEVDEVPLVGQLLQAHAYWRLKGLTVDLVFLNEHAASYLEELHEQVQNLVRASESRGLIDKPGGVFVRRAALLSEVDKGLLQAAARVVLMGSRGSLLGQVDRADNPAPLPLLLAPQERRREAEKARGVRALPRRPDLLFFNGWGGFTPDGREYQIDLTRPSGALGGGKSAMEPAGGTASVSQGALPPAPWINVIANPSFGFLISESGGGYTWAGNSQTNRLTPWQNDPVTDLPGEIVYLRDEITGEYWSTTPLPGEQPAQSDGTKSQSGPSQPARGLVRARACRVRHGQGYTIFEPEGQGLKQELLLFVPLADPLKIARLKVRNLGDRKRHLSVTFYAEWVLGTAREQALHVVPIVDADSGALLARNVFNNDFASRLAFADVSLRPRSFTCDRTEFLGRNGSLAAPAALERVRLSGRCEAALDPCAALMAPFELQAGEEKEIVFVLGQASGRDEVQRLLRRYREPGRVQAAHAEVCRRWDEVLNTVQVQTPEPSMDLLLNRWLLYQVLSCRVWARSAFYQSGGAYGFRDQLQDVMALVYSAPAEARAHIQRAAGRQFLEGDVQHWWHPPAGRGVRTRFSDDLLWLPFVVCHYVTTTGDLALLDEQAPFLQAAPLRPDQEEDYGQPAVTDQKASVYEHCVRALEHGFRLGAHGLPLMGTGDWNDGMNRVGAEGKGESVWDGWFLVTILIRFAAVAELHSDSDRAAKYRCQASQLLDALEENAWDGLWYRRAYFDDGTPLGSTQNDECKIDSLTQTWAVISGAAKSERAQQAMASVEEYLIRQADQMILLFTPPFDKGPLQPGYIKGYVPGIRENGGQYTHAATWVVQATALLGQGKRALELFNLLNPISHTSSAEKVARYRVEPYVVVADIYGQPPHTGRGGWTWYTGSAGWLYRVGLENILGFRPEGSRLRIEPCIPPHWPKYVLIYRYRSATYRITVENPDGMEGGEQEAWLDGRALAGASVDLVDDGRTHEVRIVLKRVQ
jgi:cyclic beta-1,2-glucan synthetase